LHSLVDKLSKAKQKGEELPKLEAITADIKGNFTKLLQEAGKEEILQSNAVKMAINSATIEANKIAQRVSHTTAVATERAFNILIAKGVHLIGTIDRIDQEGDAPVLTELKTRIKTWTADGNTQLQLYSYAYEKLHGKRPIKINLETLDGKKKLEFIPTQEDHNKIDHLIQEMIAHYTSLTFMATPHSVVCCACEFRSVCPNAALDQLYY